MQKLNIPYSTWKNIVQNNSWDIYHLYDSEETVSVWTGRKDLIFHADADIDGYNDWISSFYSASTLVESEDDAVAHIIGLSNTFITPLSSVGSPLIKLDSPSEADGKPVMVPAPFTDGLYMFVSARGDEKTDGVVSRGTGTKLVLIWNGDGYDDVSQEVLATFEETVEMHDGHVDFDPDDWGVNDDWSVFIRIPATSVTADSYGAGNCNLVAAQQMYPWDENTSYTAMQDFVTYNGVNYLCVFSHSGMEPPSAVWLPMVNVIVPAVGDGAYNVDTSTAIIVPYEGAGYWDYDVWDDLITPSMTPGQADWMLFDFQLDDIYLVRNMMCSSRLGYWELDAYKVELIYARWMFGLKVTRNSSGPGTIGGHYTCFREDTT